MDDYAAASKERALDTLALHKASPNRRTKGAVHLGGITLECILKDMIFTYHSIKNWGQRSKRTGDVIQNPSHKLETAIGLVDGVRVRLEASQEMKEHFQTVLRIGGGYIHLRYKGGSIPNARYEEWYQAYDSLKKWLIQQKMSLPK